MQAWGEHRSSVVNLLNDGTDENSSDLNLGGPCTSFERTKILSKHFTVWNKIFPLFQKIEVLNSIRKMKKKRKKYKITKISLNSSTDYSYEEEKAQKNTRFDIRKTIILSLASRRS